MSKEYKNSITILILGIIGTLFLILGVVMLSIYTMMGVRKYILVESIHGYDWAISHEANIMMAVGATAIIVTFILSLTASIKILMGKYNNKQIDSLRTIMGILTLILIGPIGAIIFGIIAMCKLKYVPQDFINTETEEASIPII